MENLYTIKEVAQKLHRTEKTVRKYIGNGLKVCDLDKGYLVLESDLMKFLESKKFPKEQEQ